MYAVDELDEVVRVEHFPPSDVGAPIPLVLADELSVAVAYHLPTRLEAHAESHADGESEEGDPNAVVVFRFCRAHFLGAPNDEAFAGHPLASRGLTPYAAFEIRSSSWIRGLERMNRVHRAHRAEHFARYKHHVLAFHDSTFECVATSFEVLDRFPRRGIVVERMRRALLDRSAYARGGR